MDRFKAQEVSLKCWKKLEKGLRREAANREFWGDVEGAVYFYNHAHQVLTIVRNIRARDCYPL